MELMNSTSSNSTFAGGEAATKQGPDLCYPLPSGYFETLNTTVPYIVNSALNILAGIMATSENILVFLAIRHVTSIRLPSKLMLCSLVLVDIGIGLVVQPGFVMLLAMKINRASNPNCFLVKSHHFAASLFTHVLLYTMTAISLDRYIALFFHLKYNQIVTVRRASAVLSFIWSFALFHAASTSVWKTNLWNTISLVSTSICFLIISVTCIKIYRWLRHQYGHQVQDQAQAKAQRRAGSTLNVAKYRRTASAMLWVCILVILCYLPYTVCSRLITAAPEDTALLMCILEFCYSLLLFNSCLNPFVYFYRLPEIRAEVLKQLRKLMCC